MNFLRENMILVVIVAVTLVGSIVLASAIKASGATADAGLAARVDQNKRIESSRKQKANPQIIKDEELWVEAIKRDAQRLANQEILANREGYELLTYTIADGSDGGPKNLFPVTDPKLFEKNATLPWQITEAYGKKLWTVLARLNSTAVPTEAEIQEELSSLERRMTNEARKKGLPPRKETSRSTTSTPRINPGPRGGSPTFSGSVRYGSPNPSGGQSLGTGGRSADADIKDKALKNAIVRKAKQGRIYADINCLDIVFPEPQDKVLWTQLWWAQVNLWLTGDIVDAIADTNDEVLNKLQQDQRNVINSPVKQLISLSIDKKYFTGGKIGTIGGSQRGRGGASSGGPMSGMQRYRPTARRGGRNNKPSSSSKSASNSETLTGHASTSEYDVVMYELSVVTAVRHLPLLLRKLQMGNRHTVLTVVMDDIDQSKGSGLYFSNESVMRVTIQGEARFLTAWERGTKKTEASEGYLALMPVDVLKTLPKSALRGEDSSRLGGGKKKSTRKSRKNRRK